MTITTPLSPEQIAQTTNNVFELSKFTTTGYTTYRWFTATSYDVALKLMREVAILFHSSYDIPSNRTMNYDGWTLRDELTYRIHGYVCIEDFLDEQHRSVDEIYDYILSNRWLTCYPANVLYPLSQIDGD